MKNRLNLGFLIAAMAAFFMSNANAQVIGTGNTFNPARDEVGIARDGTLEGYATAASVLAWVQANITFPADLSVSGVAFVAGDIVLTMSDSTTISATLPADVDTTNATLATVGANLVLTDSAGGTVAVSAADLAALVDGLITHPGVSADANNDLTVGVDGLPYFDHVPSVPFDPTALQAEIDANEADIAAHVLSDLDTDATNELGALVILPDGTTSYDADGNADQAAVDMATQAELNAAISGLPAPTSADDTTTNFALTSSYDAATGTATINGTGDDNGTGSTSFSVTPWATGTGAGANPAASQGLGQIKNHPINRAKTVAEISEDDHALSELSARCLLTNRAADPAACGYMNADGKVGNASKLVVLPMDGGTTSNIDDDNGFTLYLPSSVDDTRNGPFVINLSGYRDQVMHIIAGNSSSNSPDEEILVEFQNSNFTGMYRNPVSGEIIEGWAQTQLVMRHGETMTFLANGGATWLVRDFDYNLLSGTYYQELESGDDLIWGPCSFNPGLYPHAYTAVNGADCAAPGQSTFLGTGIK